MIVRSPDPERRGTRTYKKGWEVRFAVKDQRELARLVRWLEHRGVLPGRAFEKCGVIVLPVYGYEQMRRLARVSSLIKPRARTRRARRRLGPTFAEHERTDPSIRKLLRTAERATDAQQRDAAVAALADRDFSLAEIARRLGVSRQRIHQRLRRRLSGGSC